MTYRGQVKGGVVVLDGEVNLPDGARVRVDLIEQPDNESSSLLERLGPVIGKAVGLSADAASNIDRDLYGDKDA